MSYSCCNDTYCTTSITIHEYAKALYALQMYRLNSEDARVMRASHLYVGEIRYDCTSCLWCDLPHPRNGGVVHI